MLPFRSISSTPAVFTITGRSPWDDTPDRVLALYHAHAVLSGPPRRRKRVREGVKSRTRKDLTAAGTNSAAAEIGTCRK